MVNLSSSVGGKDSHQCIITLLLLSIIARVEKKSLNNVSIVRGEKNPVVT